MKPRFNIEKYKDIDAVCMCCRTDIESIIFTEFLRNNGLKWIGGGSYLDNYISMGTRKYIAYYFNRGTWGDDQDEPNPDKNIIKLNFSDYIWGVNPDIDKFKKIIEGEINDR